VYKVIARCFTYFATSIGISPYDTCQFTTLKYGAKFFMTLLWIYCYLWYEMGKLRQLLNNFVALIVLAFDFDFNV
jgi:hypothetical protein